MFETFTEYDFEVFQPVGEANRLTALDILIAKSGSFWRSVGNWHRRWGARGGRSFAAPRI